MSPAHLGRRLFITTYSSCLFETPTSKFLKIVTKEESIVKGKCVQTFREELDEKSSLLTHGSMEFSRVCVHSGGGALNHGAGYGSVACPAGAPPPSAVSPEGPV